MSDRFERLYKLPENLYVIGSPIIISAGALLKDRETDKVIVQLKFHSVTNSLIKGVKLSLNAYDISGTEIKGVDDYQYLDLSVRNGQDFGSKKAIFMPDAVTRSFAMKKLTVIMSSGDIVDVPVTMHPLPSKRLLQSELNNTELVKQYNIATNPSALYVPQESNHLWMCACGKWNNVDCCTKCYLQKDIVFSSYDLESLTEKMNARLKTEQERLQEEKRKEEQQRLLEEKELIKKREEDKERKILITKKIKKIICVSTPIILSILVFSLWLWPKVIHPTIAYGKAEKLLSSEQYDEAFYAFKSLENYKDASVMAKEALYRKALYKAETEVFEESIYIFEKLSNYKKSKELLIECKYQLAIKSLEENNDAKAFNLFKDISSYEESEEYLSKFEFIIATKNDGSQIATYNKDGLLISREGITDDYTITYKYDKSNRLISSEVSARNSEYIPRETTTTYEYDSKGNLILEHETGAYYYSSAPKEEIIEYVYSSDNKLIKQTNTRIKQRYLSAFHRYQEYEMVDIDFFEYNQNGELFRKYSYDFSDLGVDLEISYEEYTYDSYGNCDSEITYYLDDSAQLSEISQMVSLDENERNEIISSALKTFSCFYTYEDGLLAEKKHYNSSKDPTQFVLTKYDYEYDDFGNLITATDSSGYKTIYTYTPIYVRAK